MAVDGDNEKHFDMFDEEATSLPAECTKNKKSILDMTEVAVLDPDKRTAKTGLNMQDTYIVYLIETMPKDVSGIDPDLKEVSSVWRRYSEFELLRNYLAVTYPAIVLPPLPEKRTNFVWTKIASDTFDPEFLERRRVGLQTFLHRICGHENVAGDQIIVKFLKQEEGWRDAVASTGYQSKADSWLRNLNASWRVKTPDPGFEELKTYATDLHNNIANVLRFRAKLADRVYGMYKVHANYSRIFKEWSEIEDSKMSQSLRRASLEVDCLSNSIDSLMDEEELFAEQLKEYFYFADSLKAIVKKHEALQYDLEQIENQMSYAHAEKKQLSGGASKNFSLSGMKAKLFGGDIPDQKEIKIDKVSKQIEKLEEDAEEKRDVTRCYILEAKEEVEKFKGRKKMDLREILTNYMILQIRMAKESKDTWLRFRAIMHGL